MKDICSAKVIVDTKQMKDAIMQRMIIMFLFFIYNSPAFNTPFELFDNSSSFKNLHFFYIFTSAFITHFTTFSTIPHLRRFFFCAVINTYFKSFCFKPALGAVRINGYWSPVYTIYSPKLRFSTAARAFF